MNPSFHNPLITVQYPASRESIDENEINLHIGEDGYEIVDDFVAEEKHGARGDVEA